MSGAMAGVMVGINIDLLQKGAIAAEAAWPALTSRGLALGWEGANAVVPKGRPRLDGVVDGVRCEVSVRTDLVHYAETQVIAHRAVTSYKLGVWGSRGGVVGAIRDWVHGDVKLGDAAFDERFLITAEPSLAAAEALTTERRAWLTTLVEGRFQSLTVREDLVTVTFSGVEVDVATLNLALDLAASLARP